MAGRRWTRCYDRLLLVLADRPNAQVIQSREGDIDAAYAELLDRLEVLTTR